MNTNHLVDELLDNNCISVILFHVYNFSDSAEQMETFVREKVKNIYYIDVTQDKPLGENTSTFDVILTSYCLESAVADFPSYRQCFHNIAQLVNKGGFLIMAGVIGGKYYQVNNYKYKSVQYTEEDIKSCVKDEGFDIIHYETVENDREVEVEIADYTSYFFLVAKLK